jgi:hypothetical protein
MAERRLAVNGDCDRTAYKEWKLVPRLLVHASSKSRSVRPRRVLHIEYAAKIEIATGMRLAMA